MMVIPSIDILGGKVVQLVGGKPETATYYGSPEAWLQKWAGLGAPLVHLIDLDAALGTGNNRTQIIGLITSSPVPVQVGGGIRTKQIAEEYIAAGARRIIIGTRALDFEFMQSLQAFGKDRLMAALDFSKGRIVTEGWKKRTAYTLAAAKTLEPYFGSLLYTNVDIEGQMAGVASSPINTSLPAYLAGGISTLEDIKTAERAGFEGVVVGMALYKNKLGPELWK